MSFPALERIEALTRNLDAWQRDLAARVGDLADSTAQGESDSGLVQVTAAADGKILAVHLNPRAMRLDSQTLGEEVTAAANRAQDAAAARVRELVAEVIGTEHAPATGAPAEAGYDGGHGHGDH
jgi:DNA-binding protein YbaB